MKADGRIHAPDARDIQGMDHAIPPQSPQKQQRHDQRLRIATVDRKPIEPNNDDTDGSKKRQTRQGTQAPPPPTPPIPRRHRPSSRRTPRINRGARRWVDDRLEVAQILMRGRRRSYRWWFRRTAAAALLLEGHHHRPFLINRQGARRRWVDANLRGLGRDWLAVRLIIDTHASIIPHQAHMCVHLTPACGPATTPYPANTVYQGASLRRRPRRRVHAP